MKKDKKENIELEFKDGWQKKRRNTALQAVYVDKKINCVKKVLLWYNAEENSWITATKILNRQTLETVTLTSVRIAHKSMCIIIKMFFMVNGPEINADS